jgi:hypothetical protein
MSRTVSSDTPSPLRGRTWGGPAWLTTDQLGGISAFVERDWGSHGYAIAILGFASGIDLPERLDIQGRVAVAEVAASDGAHFHVAADRWGNCYFLGAC